MKLLLPLFVFSNGFLLSLGRENHHQKSSQHPTPDPLITDPAQSEASDHTKQGAESKSEEKNEKVTKSQEKIQNDDILVLTVSVH